MAASQPLVTVESFKGDFTTSKLLSRLSDRILDQYDARVASKGSNARTNTKQAPTLPYDSIVAMDQLLMQFERQGIGFATLFPSSRQTALLMEYAC